MEHLLVTMDVNDLADFVFKQNQSNKHVNLTINGIDTTKDLFCFCLDMLCKGLVLLHGQDNRVAINSLSMEQFAEVQNKMRCLGIDCTLAVFKADTPAETLLDLWTQNFLNVQKVRMSDDNARLEDYRFDLQTSDTIYKITFKLLPTLGGEVSRERLV